MEQSTNADRALLLPAADSLVYLNTGSAGPQLSTVAAALTSAIDHEVVAGRADGMSWAAFLESRTGLREALGRLVGASPDEIALTHHTTEGLNLALWGLPWQPGDRIAMTSLEHDAGIAAVHTIARRFGLVVDVIDCGDGGSRQVVEAMRTRLAAAPPRLVVASHVAWSTGAVLPIIEIAEAAHEVGAALLVDGAQAVGNVSVDVTALGADFYAFNGYKWLCGPEGSGALVVRAGWHDRLMPSHGGAFGVEGATLRAGDVDGMRAVAGAARYESGSWFRPQFPAMHAAIEWFDGEVRAGRGPAHVERMARLCAERLRTEAGAVIHTPEGDVVSGLVAFSMPGRVSSEVSMALEQRGVIIRSIPTTGNLRASCAAFTTESDIDALITALAGV